MSLSKKYDKSLANKSIIRLKTIHPDGDTLDGVVVHKSRNYIVIARLYDFEFDGFVLLPKKVIKGYRDGHFEECFSKIIRHNGEIKKIEPPKWLEKCISIKSILQFLQAHNIWPAIELLSYSSLYLGKITDVRKDAASIYCYDAKGEWEVEYKIPYRKIFKIEFESKYCTHFNNYMRSLQSNKNSS